MRPKRFLAALLLLSLALVLILSGANHATCGDISPLEITKTNLAQKIIFSALAGYNWQLWAINPDESGLGQLTHATIGLHYPSMSSFSRHLAFVDDEGAIWISASGDTPQRIPNAQYNCAHPAWSPDGKRLVFTCYSFADRKEDSDLWITDVREGNASSLLTLPGIQKYPAWSPDGKTIAFTSGFRQSSNKVIEELWLVNHDGTNPQALVANGFSNVQPDWSPDGARIAFASDHGGNMDIWVIDKDGGNLRQLTHDRGSDSDPNWSPDGIRICFVSTRGGKMDIWVMDSDGGNQKQVTGLAGGQTESKEPFWVR